MASSSNSGKSFHVFLSFRGPDVYDTFLGHLYRALNQSGIYAYLDREELRKGEQITPGLVKAIEDSRIAIVIFSKDYASASWCLDELTKIMECKEQKGLIVLPVFFKVEPREVRTPRGIYSVAMAKHKKKFRNDPDKVERWSEALLEAGNLSGWDFADGSEAELVQKIVEETLTLLSLTPLDVAQYPVGIDSRVKEVEKILKLQSKDNVLLVGLWGQGGVGKTTLANAIYNAIVRDFEGSCFLNRVRENSKHPNGLVHLQEQLLSQIFPGKNEKIFGVDGGSKLIKDKLCSKRVLIILDDVDHADQLSCLARGCKWFGQGSRIIVTTRDMHVLKSYEGDLVDMYKVKVLEDDEALELFKKYAFPENQEIKIPINLVDDVSRCAGGLPLGVKVLGSFLRGRGKQEWEETLQDLAESSREEINDVLKVSYYGLKSNAAKDIFLDIACFFKGRKIEYIKKVLDSCGFRTSTEVKILIERSLIFEEHGTLQMHDLMESMGKDIVREECLDDPGKRSRLWTQEDVFDVLSRDVVTKDAKAIVLELPEPERTYINPKAFQHMMKLRLLIMLNVDNSPADPIHLPNTLMWFQWPNCPSVLEFSKGPKKLVGLDMRKSKIKVPEQFKEFNKLKFLDLSECQSVVSMPDISCMPNLAKLDLHGCKKLERIPDISNKNTGLREISLEGTAIKELPTSIGNVQSLEVLHLPNCKKLTTLPSSIYVLQNLENLCLFGCSKLTKFPKVEEDLSDPHTKAGFPRLYSLNLGWCHLSEVEFLENFSCFPRLQYLNLSGNNFTNLPSCEQLYSLTILDVSNCQKLQEISKMPEKLRMLEANNCESLSRIPSNICIVRVHSCLELARNGMSMNDWLKPEEFHHQTKCQIVLPGGEMPKWLLPNEEGYVSFTASKDLYDKFLRVAFCVVFRSEKERSLTLSIETFINGRRRERHSYNVKSFNLDHVWLYYTTPTDLWGVHKFGPNESSIFHIRVTLPSFLDKRVIVKKCGFRLICKSLENDLEVLLQDDQLLDSALLYEVGYGDSQMSTEEDSPSGLVHKGLNIADFSIEKFRYTSIGPLYRNVRPGGEMPEEFFLVEHDTISFIASQDVYDGCIGLALCIVFGVEDGKSEVSFDIVPHVDGQRRNVLSGIIGSFDSDHTWFQFLEPNLLWGLLEGAVDFSHYKESCLRFSLTVKVLGGTLKKLGYLMSCKQQEFDLKVVLKGNQFVNLASFCEDYFQEGTYGEILAKECLKFRSDQVKASNSEAD